MLNNKSVYIPALSCGTILTALTINDSINNKSFRFYNNEENPVFNYPYLLSSSGHLAESNPQFSKDINFNLNNGIMFGDSGGYQFATGVKKFNESIRNNIFQWLENNTNYASNIDIPPYISGQIGGTTITFDNALGITLENMKYFEISQTGKTKFLNVLHGRTKETISHWYEKVKDFDFKGGWAMGSVAYSSFLTLYDLLFLIDKKEYKKFNSKNSLFHIFGISSIHTMLMLIYVQHKLNQKNIDLRISFDSATPVLRAALGSYIIGYSKQGFQLLDLSHDLNNKKIINKNISMPCDCPICKGNTWEIIYDNLQERNGKGSFKSRYYNILTLHNIWFYLKAIKQFEKIIYANVPLIFQDFFPKIIINMFKAIDNIFESPEGKWSENLFRYKNIFKPFKVEVNAKNNLSEFLK